MNFDEKMLVIIFFEIFIVFLYVLRSNEILVDIEKDRKLAKEKERIRQEELFKHLEDIKILKEKTNDYKIKEINEEEK